MQKLKLKFTSSYRLLTATTESTHLLFFITLTGILIIIQTIQGIQLNEIHLISDAFHELLHLFAFLFSWIALLYAKRMPDLRFTFGYTRLETLSAFSNCIFLYFVTLFVCFRNIHHFLEESEAKHVQVHTIVQQKLMIYNGFKLMISFLGIVCFWKYKFFLLDNNKTEIKQFSKSENEENGISITDDVKTTGDLTKLMLKQKSQEFEKNIESIVNVMQSFSKNTINYYKNQTISYYENFPNSSHFENLHSVFIHFFVSELQIISFIFLNYSNFLVEYYANLILPISIFVITIYCCKNIIISTGKILLQFYPKDNENELINLMNEINVQVGVLKILETRVWGISTGHLICTMKIQICRECDEVALRKNINIILRQVFTEIVVQFEY